MSLLKISPDFGWLTSQTHVLFLSCSCSYFLTVAECAEHLHTRCSSRLSHVTLTQTGRLPCAWTEVWCTIFIFQLHNQSISCSPWDCTEGRAMSGEVKDLQACMRSRQPASKNTADSGAWRMWLHHLCLVRFFGWLPALQSGRKLPLGLSAMFSSRLTPSCCGCPQSKLLGRVVGVFVII